MTTNKLLKIGIIGNLIFGNGCLMIMSGFQLTLFMLTMSTIMSITCTCIYLLFFRYIQYQKRHPITLFILSMLCCMVIVFIGAFFISMTISPTTLAITPHEIAISIGVGIMIGIMGNIKAFPIIFLMGFLNGFWFIWMKKYRNIALKHVDEQQNIISVREQHHE